MLFDLPTQTIPSRLRCAAVERSSKPDVNAHLVRRAIGVLIAVILIGCKSPSAQTAGPALQVAAIKGVDLSVPAQVVILDDGIKLSSPKNAWTDFVLQLDRDRLPPDPMLRLPKTPGIFCAAFQVLPAAVDLNDAQYIRQTGQSAIARSVPRVLLPLPINHGAVDLSQLKRTTQPVLIWVDVYVSDTTPPGEYTDHCDLLHARSGQSTSSVPVTISVENISLPSDIRLHFAAALNWSTLNKLHPDIFQEVPPRLLSRADPRYSTLLKILGDYLQLSHENKTDFYVPRLQPIVKWPLGKIPEIDWTDFDSLVVPWLTGSGFSDRLPTGFWPLPEPDSLAGFNLPVRAQYWQFAAAHFDQMHRLDESPVVLKGDTDGEANQAGAILLSAEARQILAVHPHVRTMLRLRDDQLQLQSPGNSNAINPDTAYRLWDLAQGLVCYSPIRNWKNDIDPPRHWIDQAGACTPDEQSIRSLAWLAFSHEASLVLCGNPLPTGSIAKATDLIWCYPGKPYGVDHPLATIQLKWLRQAEQDYECLCLAAQAQTSPMKICDLLTQPVQLQPAQKASPLLDLFAGNPNPHGCESARQLIVHQLTHHNATQPGTIDPIELQTLRWMNDRQKPTLVATGVKWIWNLDPNTESAHDGDTGGGNWIDAQLQINAYNPGEPAPGENDLQWANVTQGWEIPTDPTNVPSIAQHQVNTLITQSRVNLTKISSQSRQPLQLNLIDDFSRQTVPCKVMLPVAISERRQKPIVLDGALDDWFPADAIQLNQPLVNMLNRPALQAGNLELADTASSIYTAWSDDNFYLAFRLGGVSAADLRSTRNFVQYENGRAWGEDLCELLIQPIYIDNTLGPTLHVVCKPGGSWVEQQQLKTDTWQPFEACGIRYASGVDPAEKVWRGEVSIPWKAIKAAGHGRPALLRFNFVQHQQSTAQSASWAGPIDQSRDGKLAGLLLLKDSQ